MLIDDQEKFPSFSAKALLLGLVLAVAAHGVLVFYWFNYESVEHAMEVGSALSVNIELKHERLQPSPLPESEVATSETTEALNKETFNQEILSKKHPLNRTLEPAEQNPESGHYSSSEKRLLIPSLNIPLGSLLSENKKEKVFSLESDTQLWVRGFAPEWNSGESSADDSGDGRIFDPRLRASLAFGRSHGNAGSIHSLTTYKNAYGNDIIRSSNGKRCFKLIPSDTPNVPDQVSLPFACDGELSESEKMAEALRNFQKLRD